MFLFTFPWDEIVHLDEPWDGSDRTRLSNPTSATTRTSGSASQVDWQKKRLNGNRSCATLLSDQQTGQHQIMSRGLPPVSVNLTHGFSCLSIWGASRPPWSRGLSPVSVTRHTDIFVSVIRGCIMSTTVTSRHLVLGMRTIWNRAHHSRLLGPLS